MASIKTNGFYNNPDFAQAALQLANAFGPPKGQDAYGWAEAAATRDKAARLSEAFNTITNPATDQNTIDRFGIGAGMYQPNQSYYGVNATNATSRANNTADNANKLDVAMLAPVARDATRFVPQAIADRFNVPTQQSGVLEMEQGRTYQIPGQEQPVAGPAKPLTEDQVKAQTLQTMSPDQRIAVAFGNTPTEQVAGPSGQPVLTTRPQAIGQPVYNNPADAAKKLTNVTAVLNDGTEVPAFQDPLGFYRNAQTGERLPNDIHTHEVPRPQGSNNDLGIGKGAQTEIDKRIINLKIAQDTASTLYKLINIKPNSQGIVGWLRGKGQDIIQQGGEVGQWFGGSIAQANDMIAKGLVDAGLDKDFDPTIPTVQLTENLLALSYAQAITPADRVVGKAQMENAKTALGLSGLNDNQKSTSERLKAAVAIIQHNKEMLMTARQGGTQALMKAPSMDTAPQAMPAGPGMAKKGLGDIVSDVLHAGGDTSPAPADAATKMENAPPAPVTVNGQVYQPYLGKDGGHYVVVNGQRLKVD